MTIYLDVVIVENLIMDAIIIYATAIVLKNKKTHLRFFLASMLGAIYTIISYTSALEVYTSIILKILLSIILKTVLLIIILRIVLIVIPLETMITM